MIVYVESNFVLELALLQEQYQACENILSLCETSEVCLVLPAICLTEPLDTLVRRTKDKKALAHKLEVEIKQLSRTALYQIRLDRLQEILDLLLLSGENEILRLFQKLDRILKVSEIIQITPKILALAMEFQVSLKLSPQDSVVYASVVHHLESSDTTVPKGFFNRNSKDFQQLDIQTTLERHNCKLFFNFEKGYNYLRNQVIS